MNKYQQALNQLIEDTNRYNGDIIENDNQKQIDVLQGLIDKTTPKKVKELHYEEEGEKPYIKRVCPNGCRVQIYPVTSDNKAHEQRYCHKCGQKIYSEYLDDELEITDEEWEQWNR